MTENDIHRGVCVCMYIYISIFRALKREDLPSRGFHSDLCFTSQDLPMNRFVVNKDSVSAFPPPSILTS